MKFHPLFDGVSKGVGGRELWVVNVRIPRGLLSRLLDPGQGGWGPNRIQCELNLKIRFN